MTLPYRPTDAVTTPTPRNHLDGPRRRDVLVALGFAFAMWAAATVVCLTAGNVVFPVADTPAAYLVTIGVGGVGAALLAWTVAHLYQRTTCYSFVHRATFVLTLVGLGLGLDAILMTAAGHRYPLLDDDRQLTIELFMISAYTSYTLAPVLAVRSGVPNRLRR